MKTLTKKQAILQSLDAMNASEMEKVLDYIKNLLYDQRHDRNYERLKERAMKEIKKALRKNNGINFAG